MQLLLLTNQRKEVIKEGGLKSAWQIGREYRHKEKGETHYLKYGSEREKEIQQRQILKREKEERNTKQNVNLGF